ncbi:FecCD family ABC transporter permease [Teichococcus vastitatis]|uniref:Iron ABC transporter permease n=1 Tax=Teichococcus vastitatis TaxID=2307076 RepID=A0ABS9W7A2_9PROT|nr:iron ABC transporter permease [Pseudoroseomonas vastitatis]MCI0755161.1 iron ABC transporter permease [Pseudoroseomonas vastitatis]
MTAFPADAIIAWRAANSRRVVVMAVGIVLLVASFAADLATGPAMLPIPEVVRSLLGMGTDPMLEAIVHRLRLPIALMAVAVGASLGLTGAVMQTILNNPLASSYTLGISAGAGFGAALAILAGAMIPLPPALVVPAAAFLFAGLACSLVAGAAQLRGATPEFLVLSGIVCLFLFQALLSLLQFLASPEALQQIVFWLFGSLMRASLGQVGVVGLVLLLSIPLLLRDAWQLTALRLGDERARALGVQVDALRLRAFILVSLLTGVAVAFVGTIGFVGLVAPHIARMLVGEDQRHLLPSAAIFGALLLSAASVASKLIMPGAVFPIGIVTSLIGVPVLGWLVLRSRTAP